MILIDRTVEDANSIKVNIAVVYMQWTKKNKSSLKLIQWIFNSTIPISVHLIK